MELVGKKYADETLSRTGFGVDMGKTVAWEPADFALELNAVWNFPDRGKWATHDAKYRGNWSPYIPHNLLLRYSAENDEEMKLVAAESYRVLKKDKFCAILMGDTRKNGLVVPMSFDVMKIFESSGFKLKELIIKEQHNCKATGY